MNFQNSPQRDVREVVHVDSKKVSCDGGKGSAGHPLVYLNMGNKDSVVCPYCSKYFTVSNNDQKIKHKHD